MGRLLAAVLAVAVLAALVGVLAGAGDGEEVVVGSPTPSATSAVTPSVTPSSTPSATPSPTPTPTPTPRTLAEVAPEVYAAIIRHVVAELADGPLAVVFGGQVRDGVAGPDGPRGEPLPLDQGTVEGITAALSDLGATAADDPRPGQDDPAGCEVDAAGVTLSPLRGSAAEQVLAEALAETNCGSGLRGRFSATAGEDGRWVVTQVGEPTPLG